MRLHDLRCITCQRIELDVMLEDDGFPRCPECDGPRTWVPSRINTDAWGAPRYVTSLDQTFDSRSDLKKHLRENGLIEAGDKVGGARNEKFEKKIYGYAGQSNRTA